MVSKRKDKLNEYPRQGNEEPRIDLVGNVTDVDPSKERLVKADDDNAVHLENLRNVQGSNKNQKLRR